MVEGLQYPPNLIPPAPAEGLYRRERLLRLLGGHGQRKLLVVAAPAGYGKTSLAVSFAEQRECPVFWFALEESYHDPARFLSHLALSIRRVFPWLDPATLPPMPEGRAVSPEHAAFVEALASEFSARNPEGSLLVLDNFHCVQNNEAIVGVADLLLSRLPASCQILLLSRTQASLPSLPRMVAYGQAARLSVQDLAFTEEEAAGWLEESGLGLTTVEASGQLWARYEGWIAGMVLAATQPSTEGAETFGPEDRDWFSYLNAEVYRALPPSIQDFLCRTSVLPELDAGACEGLLGTENAAELLKALSDTWQLVQRVPRKSRFRCLAGVRSFLLHRLREEGEAQVAATHRRAAEYFLGQEAWEAAVHHFCEAGRPEEAATALQGVAPAMYKAGQWARLAGLIDLLPGATLDRYPALVIFRSRCAAQTGNGEEALRLSGQALDLLHEGPDDVLAQAHVARAAAFRLLGMLDHCCRECDRSIALLAGTSGREARLTLAESYHYKGTAYNQGGKLQEANEALSQALDLYREDGDFYHIAYVHHHLGSVYRALGEFGRSAAQYREAESAWRKLGNWVALASTLNNLGNLYLDQGRLPASEEALAEAARHAEEGNSPRVLSYALATLGDLLRHLGQYNRALTTYRQGTEAARECSEHKTLVQNVEGLALTYLALGDSMTARITVEEAVGFTGGHTGAEILGQLLTSQSVVQRSLGLYREARRSIKRARQLLEQGGSNVTRARCAFHYAALLWAEHEADIQPLLQEVATLLAEPGTECVLLADARLSLPFVQGAAGPRKSDSVFQRLLSAVAACPGESREESLTAASMARPLIRAYSLGSSIVERADQQPSRVRWGSEKTKELFFFLLVRNEWVQKEDILDALWPDLDPGKAATIFWTTTSRLRHNVHPDCLVRQGSAYRINPALNIWFDAEELDGLVREAFQGTATDTERASRLQGAINLYGGPFLCELYSEWLDATRRRLEQRYLSCLLTLAQIWAEKSVVDPVVELCDRALEIDPYHEEAASLRIEALVRAGRLAEADAAFQAYAKSLAEELQEQPGGRVAEVSRRLAQSRETGRQ